MPIPIERLIERPYSIMVRPDGTARIYCLTCGRKSEDGDDVYFRRCRSCGFLGAKIRQRWDAPGQYEWLKGLCEAVGRYQRVHALSLGTDHAVPTEQVATEGLRGDQISDFPKWDETYAVRRSADKLAALVLFLKATMTRPSSMH